MNFTKLSVERLIEARAGEWFEALDTKTRGLPLSIRPGGPATFYLFVGSAVSPSGSSSELYPR